jgi:hypothetical protein|tara:strand:- start:203 stop:355 length:153 start_codon:yes stop_codon:yes gene_type:complete
MPHPEIDLRQAHGETISISGIEPRFNRAPLLGEHDGYVLGVFKKIYKRSY